MMRKYIEEEKDKDFKTEIVSINNSYIVGPSYDGTPCTFINLIVGLMSTSSKYIPNLLF
jgi:hypothetical protein